MGYQGRVPINIRISLLVLSRTHLREAAETGRCCFRTMRPERSWVSYYRTVCWTQLDWPGSSDKIHFVPFPEIRQVCRNRWQTTVPRIWPPADTRSFRPCRLPCWGSTVDRWRQRHITAWIVETRYTPNLRRRHKHDCGWARLHLGNKKSGRDDKQLSNLKQ